DSRNTHSGWDRRCVSAYKPAHAYCWGSSLILLASVPFSGPIFPRCVAALYSVMRHYATTAADEFFFHSPIRLGNANAPSRIVTTQGDDHVVPPVGDV